MRLPVTVDVPDPAAGIAFWGGAFGHGFGVPGPRA